uniref:F5/8 type C domain-containing protein n=1 Tax=Diacronema lutheri TaxID=2081491 RepID=A0A7R9UIW6_DIALT
MLHRCASERFVRRVFLPLVHHVELIDHILSFLKLPQVTMSEVTAVKASSSAANDRQCSAANTLSADDGTWWLSAPDSCPNGVGAEWVLYRLRPAVGARARFQYVQMKIPKLPYGPLSVRVFHVEVADDESGPFVRVGPDLTTFNTDRMQEWALPTPVECACVRLVLTKNAAACELEDKWLRLSGMRLSEASCIGFLRVGFA